MTIDLAIVIPAYKGRFLDRTLASIAAQTDQRFRVYVGDDASPDRVEAITRASRLDPDRLVYHRFQGNLGGTSLARHWERCIRLSHERWIWLFSDDDLMEPECVAALYQTLGDTAETFDVYRFNTITIDAGDNVRRLNPPHPPHEDWHQFAYFLLRDLRVCTQQECVFRRRKFEDVKGFLDLPLAWATDHAFAIACGTDKGLVSVAGPRVRFRHSGVNISSSREWSKNGPKVDASIAYLRWLARHLDSHPSAPGRRGEDDLIRQATWQWFEGQVRALRSFLGASTMFKVAQFMSEARGESIAMSFLRLCGIHIEITSDFATSVARRVIRGRNSWNWDQS